MELSWSTFLLEIFNFLVLVWILKRFLYRPIQSVIARRQQDIDARLAQASEKEAQAQQLQNDYEGRLAQWRDEREQSREALEKELRSERTRREKLLADDLEQQRAKSTAVDQRRQGEQRRQLELQAMEQGSRFAAKLLEQGAGPETETRLVKLFLASLADMPEAQRLQLCAQLRDTKKENPLQVASAHSLDAEMRKEIELAITACLGPTVACRFVEQPALIAGIQVSMGAWAMGLNVRDELQGFARLAPDAVEG
ncbi:F0F1 ATP synthase subunit delta [Microbulbifer bruguierae]|uniref:ATP synthase subunit b n=1 Tax=Microbulbifer bruguierae TaxID=3029061 RepID=A0ABY8NFB3_9GAMM|nr:F0F1 ATP synthase subunit delta [Microbulbifer bruguierae]WGL17120.1 F0F1 ATP synthase subunit delta [Microbulbifer bruguierae]